MKRIIYILTVAIFLTIIEGIFVCDLYALNMAPRVAHPTDYTGVENRRMPAWTIDQILAIGSRRKRIEIMNNIEEARRLINRYVEHSPLIAGEMKERNMIETQGIVESAARFLKGAGRRGEGTNPDGTRSVQYTGTHLSGLLRKLDEHGLGDVKIGGRTLREKILEAYGGDNIDNIKYVWSLNVNSKSLDKLGNLTRIESVTLKDRKYGLPRVRFTRAKEQVYSEDMETGEYGTTEVITKRWEDNIEYIHGSKDFATNFGAPRGRKRTNAHNLIKKSRLLVWDSREPGKTTEIITKYIYDIASRLATEEHRTFIERWTAPDGTEIERRWKEIIEIDPENYKLTYTADLEGVTHLRTHFQRKIFGKNWAPDLIQESKIWQVFDKNDLLKGSFTFLRETGADGLDRSSIYIKQNIVYDPVTGITSIRHEYINIPYIEPDQVADFYKAWRNGKLGEFIGSSGIATLEGDSIDELDRLVETAETVLYGNDPAREVAESIDVETAGRIEEAKSDAERSAERSAERWVGRELDPDNPEHMRILGAWRGLFAQGAIGPGF